MKEKNINEMEKYTNEMMEESYKSLDTILNHSPIEYFNDIVMSNSAKKNYESAIDTYEQYKNDDTVFVGERFNFGIYQNPIGPGFIIRSMDSETYDIAIPLSYDKTKEFLNCVYEANELNSRKQLDLYDFMINGCKGAISHNVNYSRIFELNPNSKGRKYTSQSGKEEYQQVLFRRAVYRLQQITDVKRHNEDELKFLLERIKNEKGLDLYKNGITKEMIQKTQGRGRH